MFNTFKTISVDMILSVKMFMEVKLTCMHAGIYLPSLLYKNSIIYNLQLLSAGMSPSGLMSPSIVSVTYAFSNPPCVIVPCNVII